MTRKAVSLFTEARTVIDYAACSSDLLNSITDFAIPVKEYSDHMPLVVNLSLPPSIVVSPNVCNTRNKLKWQP